MSLLLWLSVLRANPVPAVDNEPVAIPDLATSMENLDVLAEQGFAREATAQVLLALNAQPDHPDAALTRLTLSRVLRELGMVYEEDLVLAHGLDSLKWKPWFELAQLDAALHREDFYALTEAVEGRSNFDLETASAVHFYGAWGRASLGDSDGAQTLLAKVRGPLQPAATRFGESLDALPVKRRSAGLASLLSVIPGLGQLYVGETAVALADVVIVGGFGAAAGHFVIQDQPAWGTLFGVLAGAGWIGGIDSAGRSAVQYNERQQRVRFENLKEAYWLQAELTDDRLQPLRVHTPE